MPVVIRPIQETECELYREPNEFIGKITSNMQLNDVRIQIGSNKLHGYYIKWQNYTIRISNTGVLEQWPHGFFDTEMDQLTTLLGMELDASRSKRYGND